MAKTCQITRRDFAKCGALLTGGLAAGFDAAGAGPSSNRSILNHNENMEYRRLGKTGLMVSAACLGGHWKRVHTVVPSASPKSACCDDADTANLSNPEFVKNRHEVVSRCIESGINYVDACSPQEILAYSKVLKGRRAKMYFGYSWHTREPRFTEWRSPERLVQGLDDGLKEAGLDYIDVWRISLPMEGIADLGELLRVEEATVGALEMAKKQGKTRFTGVSSHNRVWLKSVIEQYPKQMEVVLFPYTANSKELPEDSLFDAIRQQDVGVFGIKPFSSNALFEGDSSPNHTNREEDDRRARLAIRHVLSNPAITAPIPGLVSLAQVDNVAKAILERRQLDLKEKNRGKKPAVSSELEPAARRMWAKLPADYQWLKGWEYV
jgi:aryl-alcohol dehydrogenase-like predicted oxidoreductase